MNSQLSLVIKDIYGFLFPRNRTLKQVVATASKVPLSLAHGLREGSKFLWEWRNHAMDVPENVPVSHLQRQVTAPNDIKALRIAMVAKAVEMAGGHGTMDRMLRTNQEAKMIRNWLEHKYIRAGLRSPIALMEYMMRPIMYFWVPRMKMSVFGEMAWRIIEQNPGKTMEELAPDFRQAWNRNDERLGQVGYDRLFIHNLSKQTFQVLMRAPGWRGGWLSAFFGAPVDAARFFKEWAKTGKAPQDIPDRVAYLIALMGAYFLFNGLMTHYFIGRWPKGIEWWYFQTADGRKWWLPAYPKSIMSLWQNPVHDLTSGLHPMMAGAAELWRGTDYYNNMFRDPEDQFTKRSWDTIKHGIALYEPFWTRGIRQVGEGESIGEMLKSRPGEVIMPYTGVMPVTRAVTEGPEVKLMRMYQERKPHETLTPEKAETSRIKRQAMVYLRGGKMDKYREQIDQLRERGMSKDEILTWLKRAGVQAKGGKLSVLEPEQTTFKYLELPQALKVYDAAPPDRKELYADLLNDKVARLRKNKPEQFRKLLPEIKRVLERERGQTEKKPDMSGMIERGQQYE